MDSNDRIANPPRHYDHPSAIMADADLTEEERVTALKNWRNDIDLKLVAASENMGNGALDMALIAEIDSLLCYLDKIGS